MSSSQMSHKSAINLAWATRGTRGHTGPGDTETGAGVINILDVCVSAGGDSAGVDIRSIIQSVTWELNSGLKQPYFCREL